MNCNQCGNPLAQNVKFCSTCGNKLSLTSEPEIMEETSAATSIPEPEHHADVAKQNPAPNKNRYRSMLFGVIGMVVGAAVLFAILLANGICTSDAKRTEGNGYATPEDAAEAYLMALRDQNMDAMMSTFAVEIYAENYDLNAMAERMQCYSPNFEIPLPNANSFTIRQNVEARRKSISQSILSQYIFHNSILGEYDFGVTIMLKDDPDLVENIEDATDRYVFEDLEITGTMDPEELTGRYSDERTQKNIAAWANIYGAKEEDVANVVITFEADGEEYVFCPQLVRYNGKWYIQSLQGHVAILLGFSMQQGGISLFPVE